MTVKIDDLIADREAGTDGPWYLDGLDIISDGDCEIHAIAETQHNVSCRSFEEDQSNARRITRVPDLEATFLEAVELLWSASVDAPFPSDIIEFLGKLK